MHLIVSYCLDNSNGVSSAQCAAKLDFGSRSSTEHIDSNTYMESRKAASMIQMYSLTAH